LTCIKFRSINDNILKIHLYNIIRSTKTFSFNRQIWLDVRKHFFGENH